jgi:predicted nuclease with RNAse H fold
MVEEFGLTVIDATLTLPEQQEMVREIIEPMLPGALRVEPSAWREVLAKESIYGRYLDEVLPERSTP